MLADGGGGNKMTRGSYGEIFWKKMSGHIGEITIKTINYFLKK